MSARVTDTEGFEWDVHVEWVGRRLDDGPLLRRWHERRWRRAEARLAKRDGEGRRRRLGW